MLCCCVAQLATLVGILGSGVERGLDDMQFMCGSTNVCDADGKCRITVMGTSPCEDMGQQDMMSAMGDFAHPDSPNLVVMSIEQTVDMQGPVVLSGLVDCVAMLLAIFAFLALKAQMSFNRKEAADEKELIAFGCLVLGFLFPLLELALRSGPMGIVGWIGGDAVRCRRAMLADPDSTCEDMYWKNFTDGDFRAMWLALQIVEALFTWLNTLTALLQAIGFLLLAEIAPTKAKNIITPQHNKISLAAAVVLAINFLGGVGREINWFAEIIVILTDAILFLIILPAWFILLAMALKKVDSIESMNHGLYPTSEAEDEKRRQAYSGAAEPAAPPPTPI